MNDIWSRLAQCRKELAETAPREADRRAKLLGELEALTRDGRRRDEAREALLHEVALVLSCTDVPRLLELTMDAAIRLSGAQRGFLLLARPDGAQDVVAARNLERTAVPDAASEISRRVVSAVLAEDRILRLEDALHTPPYSLAESVTRLKLLSVLCAPIRRGGRPAGALYLENRRLSGVFTVESERIIGQFAERIGQALDRAEAFESLRRDRDGLQSALEGECAFEGITGRSPAFRQALETILTAAAGDIPVLIEGESGTGKELVARAVHLRSPRRERAFVSLNCAALPSTLLESELFGHRRGAFTGAMRDRPGLVATANRGTLFLDEVGEMPPELQAKLLRVLQSGEYRPVGSDSLCTADVRVVAATRRRLADEVKAGRFREDLFFRLNGVHVHLPPLCERREDLPLLIRHFLERFAPDPAPAFDEAALASLMAYPYPGNVRELETIIRRAVLFAKDGTVGLDALPAEVTRPEGEVLRLPVRIPATGAELLAAKKRASLEAVRQVERAFLVAALESAGGRPGEAARRVQMNRAQFERMLSRHGLVARRSHD